MKNEPRHKFGDKLRRVRERKGVTLKSVARTARVSESLVSQIECNKVSPSIDTLMALADALDLDPEYLFRDFKKNKRVEILRKAEQRSIRQAEVTYRQLSLTPEPSEKFSVEAYLLEIPPGGEKGDTEYGHAGKELGILLEGSGELFYGTQTFLLESGDSVSFPSDIPHVLRNTGRSILKAIWIVTPPRRMFAGS
ncbi:MAG: helix-turn-helix domain-containing protein [Thermodesulfobacteriota bacterium]